MLEIKNLQATYGRKIRALHGVSLSVKAGEIVCLIGANGAGKSTLLKAVSGQLVPESGEVIFDGRRIDGWPAHRTAGMGLIHVPEGRKIFPRLTVRENLEMGAFCRPAAEIPKDIERVVSLFPVLGQRQKQLGGTLSGGEQQMLAMARALMACPRLLMLDEPSMGLAPLVVSKVFATIVDINRTGTPILLVEQNANEALRIAHRGYVIETGVITQEGSAAALKTDPKVRHAYLGVSG